jgi:3,4-dihydroxy 2-butanone 4-phosphate synthase / GTP cyclohydrolase II
VKRSTFQLDIALQSFSSGGMVILKDAIHRENEGDLVIAAQSVTPKAIQFMTQYGGGLICLPMKKSMTKKLDLKLMPRNHLKNHETPFYCAFTESIDAVSGITTGISAFDRAKTISVAIDPITKSNDLRKPGHIFPLQAHEGGLYARKGHTEASIHLCQLCNLIPAAVICEIINANGTMARSNDLEKFSLVHQIPILDIALLCHTL